MKHITFRHSLRSMYGSWVSLKITSDKGYIDPINILIRGEKHSKLSDNIYLLPTVKIEYWDMKARHYHISASWLLWTVNYWWDRHD